MRKKSQLKSQFCCSQKQICPLGVPHNFKIIISCFKVNIRTKRRFHFHKFFVYHFLENVVIGKILKFFYEYPIFSWFTWNFGINIIILNHLFTIIPFEIKNFTHRTPDMIHGMTCQQKYCFYYNELYFIELYF